MLPKIDNVLLVEDDEVDVMNVKRAFRKQNIDLPVYVAKNGVEALEMLRLGGGNHFTQGSTVILLDLNMPKMGGLEFLKELRADPLLHSLVVFVLTTSNQESDLRGAYAMNVAGYILKPLSFDVFIDTIGKLYNFWQINEFLKN